MQFEIALSRQHQKIIAIALALIPIALLVLVATSFITMQIERHTQTALLVRKLSHERAILAQAPVWHDRLLHKRTSRDWQNLFIAKTLSTNAGTTATLIKSLGGKIQQNSVRRMETAGAVEVDEHIVFSSDTEQLAKILQSMRGLRPVFVVRSTSVQSQVEAVPAAPSGPNILRVELTVAEFERPS